MGVVVLGLILVGALLLFIWFIVKFSNKESSKLSNKPTKEMRKFKKLK